LGLAKWLGEAGNMNFALHPRLSPAVYPPMRRCPPQAVESPEPGDASRSTIQSSPNAVTTGHPPQSESRASSPTIEIPQARHVLLVDDDPTVLLAISRVLRMRGYLTSTTTDGQEAVRWVTQVDYDAIVTDIAMPGMDGITLLREVRSHDLHVPVILLTGEPAVDTAVQALELGAMNYLTKPVSIDALERVLDKAVNFHRMARLRQRAAQLLGQTSFHPTDRAGLESSFARCLQTLWMAMHPIVCGRTRTIFGYEALLRSSEPSLPHPAAVIDAAERLGKLDILGQTVREHAAAVFADSGQTALLFVNLHVTDLLDSDLLSPRAPLAKIAHQVVLEITERSSLDRVPDVRSVIASLRELGYRIAVDDLGAGYAGLTSFTLLEPDFVKLDMSLIRGIDTNSTKQKVVRSMTTLCHEMGMLVVAEGVETPQECAVLVELECDLLQGFLLARPGRPFPEIQWPAQ
jgi:EAL domain-containing protein (putative c-di-GMP-specific phosphodiesterase class I)